MTHIYDLKVSVNQEWVWLRRVFWPRVSNKAAVTSKLFQKDPFPYLLSDWCPHQSGIRFLTGFSPRASVVQELLATDRPSIPCHTCLSIEHLTTWYLASSEQQRGKQRVWQKDGSHHLWGFHQSQKWHPITFAISCSFLLVWVWGNAHTLPADVSRYMRAKS